ncbi:MAG: hypothetical protein CHACPFDD_03216 [Phycisphaerae bacterium]|nr:hypothetical protein [Phycisphaerae bacterium]
MDSAELLRLLVEILVGVIFVVAGGLLVVRFLG